MDLSKAEKTLSDLKNSSKVVEVTKSIEEFKKISKELSKLPEEIEKIVLQQHLELLMKVIN